MRRLIKIKILLNSYRLLLSYLVFKTSNEKNKILKDINRWNSIKDINESLYYSLAIYLLEYKEFRALFLYRLRKNKLSILIKILFPPLESLYIACDDIGGGLFIQHGFSTIIAAKSIGENCWINQQVTIGYTSDNNCPVIEDNVFIYAGAKVLGGIVLGKSSVIGAGAVVINDVPENSLVAGVPAKIKKYYNEKEDSHE